MFAFNWGCSCRTREYFKGLKEMEIILKPIVTEKVTGLQDKYNRYGFRVVMSATKSQIKAAVEDLYGVKVLSVNTMRS